MDLPDGAQVWGPRDGWAWRIVDGHGHPPAAGEIRGTTTARTLAAQAGIEVRTGPDGHRTVYPIHTPLGHTQIG